MTTKPESPDSGAGDADTAEKLRAPYAELLSILRRDVDYGGYDGHGPDQLHQGAANAIEQLLVALASQIGIANTERAQAERLAKVVSAGDQAVAWQFLHKTARFWVECDKYSFDHPHPDNQYRALYTRAQDAKGVDADALARKFHEVYERLAPSFGYETREETRAFDPSTPNGRLMIAVCEELTHAVVTSAGEDDPDDYIDGIPLYHRPRISSAQDAAGNGVEDECASAIHYFVAGWRFRRNGVKNWAYTESNPHDDLNEKFQWEVETIFVSHNGAKPAQVGQKYRAITRDEIARLLELAGSSDCLVWQVDEVVRELSARGAVVPAQDGGV